ncbi:hypothetical protein D3C76_957090 [compost metagenome]
MLLDHVEGRQQVLEEGSGAQDQQVDAGQLAQAQFLLVHAGDGAIARGQFGADAAQCHHAAHATVADGLDYRLAHCRLLGHVIGHRWIVGQQGVDRPGAAESLGEIGCIVRLAGHHLGAGSLQLRQPLGRTAQCAHALTGLQQLLDDSFTGVPGGAHYRDHLVLLWSRLSVRHMPARLSPVLFEMAGRTMIESRRFMIIRPGMLDDRFPAGAECLPWTRIKPGFPATPLAKRCTCCA